MSTRRRPITNLVSLNYGADLERIEEICNGLGKSFLALFERWKLRTLEFDDQAALIEQVKRRLIRFALDCNALPVRSPRQIIATVRSIAEDPAAFVKEVGGYDPEASARVYGKIASRSAEHAANLERFEWGTGPAPPLDDIVRAASAVLNELEIDAQAFAKGGRQKLVLQHELTRDLAKIFEGFGGRVTRSTRFDLDRPASEREVGPFHDFLKIVLPVVQPFAMKAGLKMTSIRSLVSGLKADRAGTQE
jgi:hypothetical protein